MSGLNHALSIKRKRAETIIERVFAYVKGLEKSSDIEHVTLYKKSSRMAHALKDNPFKSDNDLDFLRVFFEYMQKVNDKFETFNGNVDLIADSLNWVNEIKPIVVFDIDDTLRDASHRMKIRHKIEAMKEARNNAIEKSEKERLSKAIDEEWQVFFLAGFDDTPKEDVIALCNMYYDAGFEVRIRTGASAAYFERTVAYLADCGVKYHHLRMRKEGVKIPDYRLKPSWISKYDLGENVFATYDDREALNENYQKKGVVNTYLVNKEFDVKTHIVTIQADFDKQLDYLK